MTNASKMKKELAKIRKQATMLTPAEAGNIAGANDNAAAEEAEFSFEVFQDEVTNVSRGTIEYYDLPEPHGILEDHGVMTLLQARDIVRDTVKRTNNNELWQYLKVCNNVFASLDTNETEATEAPQAVPSIEDIEAGNEYVPSIKELVAFKRWVLATEHGAWYSNKKIISNGYIMTFKFNGHTLNQWNFDNLDQLRAKMAYIASITTGAQWKALDA